MFFWSEWRASLFFHNTVAKARAWAARASQRKTSKRHGIVNPRLEGKLGPTYGIGDDAKRDRTQQVLEAPTRPERLLLTNPPTLLILAAAHSGGAPREIRQTREEEGARGRRVSKIKAAALPLLDLHAAAL